MTQVLLVGTRTERKSLSKIAFTERSNGTVKQTGGLQMGTSIFCLACKISSGTVKGRRGVWVCTDTQSFSWRVRGSKLFHVLPILWLNRAFPNAPRRCSVLGTLRRVNYRKETLKEDVPLKNWQQIFLIFHPEHLWILLHKGWMSNNKISHVPFSTGLLTVTGKEKKTTCPQNK